MLFKRTLTNTKQISRIHIIYIYIYIYIYIMSKFPYKFWGTKGSFAIGPLTTAHFIPQGPTNQRLGTLQTVHRPRRGRQINALAPDRSLRARKGRQISDWAPYRHLTGLARADKSASGHLTYPSQATQGPTNQRPGTFDRPLQVQFPSQGPTHQRPDALQTPPGGQASQFAQILRSLGSGPRIL